MTQGIEVVCSINPETLESGTAPDSTFHYIDISSVEKGTIDWSMVRLLKYGNAPSRARRVLRSGDVLLCTVRPGLQAHTRINFQSSVPLVGSTGFAVLRPFLETDSSFIFHQLFTDAVAAQLRALETGSNYPAVNENDIRRLKFFCPPPEVRSDIGLLLDEIDEAIAATANVIAKLQQLRTGLLRDLLTRGLDKVGQLRDPLTHPEQFADSPVGPLPTEWRFRVLDELLEGIDAGKSPDYPDKPAPPGEWGVLKVSAISPLGFRPNENKRVTKRLHQNPAYEVANGDLLISRSNTYELVGLACLVMDAPPRLMLCDKTLRLRVVPSEAINAFVALLLQTPGVRRQIEINATGTSGSMKNISQDVIRNLRLGCPDIHEQERILLALAPIDDEIGSLNKELMKLSAMRLGLRNDVLSGRFRIPAEFFVNNGQNSGALVGQR